MQDLEKVEKNVLEKGIKSSWLTIILGFNLSGLAYSLIISVYFFARKKGYLVEGWNEPIYAVIALIILSFGSLIIASKFTQITSIGRALLVNKITLIVCCSQFAAQFNLMFVLHYKRIFPLEPFQQIISILIGGLIGFLLSMNKSINQRMITQFYKINYWE